MLQIFWVLTIFFWRTEIFWLNWRTSKSWWWYQELTLTLNQPIWSTFHTIWKRPLSNCFVLISVFRTFSVARMFFFSLIERDDCSGNNSTRHCQAANTAICISVTVQLIVPCNYKHLKTLYTVYSSCAFHCVAFILSPLHWCASLKRE